MKRLAKLIEKRGGLMKKIEAAAEEGDAELFGTLEAELKALDTEIEECRATETKLAEMRASGEAIREDIEETPVRKPVEEGVSREERMSSLPLAGEDRQVFESLNHQMREVFFHGVHKRHTPNGVYDSLMRQPREARAALGISELSDKDGDFLIQPEQAGLIVDAMFEDKADIFARPNWGFTTSNGLILNRLKSYDKTTSFTGAVISYWLGEAKEATASQPEFEQLELKLHKMLALYYATDEALEDIPGITSDMAPLVALELRSRAGESFIRGNGVKKPEGILNSPVTVEVAKVAAQPAKTVVQGNINDMYAAFNGSDGVWLYNRQLWPQFPALEAAVGTGGVLTFMPPGGISGSPYASIFGMPLLPCPYCSAPGTPGDLILADWSKYKALGKTGEQVKAAQSVHVQFLTMQQAFRFAMRLDGQPDMSAPITPKHRDGATFQLSPFVTVALRA